MCEFPDIIDNITSMQVSMSITPRYSNRPLSKEEMEDMKALREAINERPASVHPDKMEKYTEYLVRSMVA